MNDRTLLAFAGALSFLVAEPGLAWPFQNVASPPVQGRQSDQPSSARTINEAFLHLQMAVDALNNRVGSDPQTISATVNAIAAQINELQDLFASSTGAAPEDNYIQNLDLAANALRKAAALREPAAVSKILGQVQRDFQIKLESARANLGAQGGTPHDIPVFVTTTKNGHAVSGYFIKLAYGDSDDEPPTFPFTSPTNPKTQRQMTPGVYYLYAYKPGSSTPVSPPQEVEFGTHGESSGDVIAPVP